MERFYLLLSLIKLTVGKLCQQLYRLVGLSLLCILLPFVTGQGAEQALSAGVSFSGVTLAITAPEGDKVPEQVERYVGGMEDVQQYCHVEAMDAAEARQALKDGKVTAVLELPKDFVSSVQRGENPDVRLIVDGQHPTEELLTLWVGQSASDLLSAVQSGIYAVLGCYEEHPIAGSSLSKTILGINLKYVQWTANRQDVFQMQTLLPTGTLPISLHYGLSLLSALLLSLGPLFVWNFQGNWLTYHRRLRLAGRSSLAGFCSSIIVITAAMLPVMTVGLAAVGGLPVLAALQVGFFWAILFAAWSACCGLLTRSATGCGCLSFAAMLAALLLSGGAVPPVMMPAVLHRLEWCSPITWMRALAVESLGYAPAHSSLGLLLTAVAVLYALCAVGYECRVRKQEDEE
ncbi:hypothetical protein OBV_34340 [Oscillibacter valericigenes Sjm18-20]|nr:hypothetical protein OBV_34340 [Oscillibacter valericigenes Sjm18-20]